MGNAGQALTDEQILDDARAFGLDMGDCIEFDEKSVIAFVRAQLSAQADSRDATPAEAGESKDARVKGITPGLGLIELDLGGDIPEWADLGCTVRITAIAVKGEAK